MQRLLFLLLHLMSQSLIPSYTDQRYEKQRKAFITDEEKLMTGASTSLTAQEVKVNNIFMKYKRDELSRGLNNPEQNTAGLHFFKAKPLIDKSSVFRFLQQMPKGSVLHLHNLASVSSEWVLRNISYMPGLLRCYTTTGASVLTFRRTPKEHNCQSQYVRVADERKKSRDRKIYDQNFERLFNLYTPNPELEYPTITSVWARFQGIFGVLGDALSYMPAFRTYHWQMLQELYDDNVMYAEIRTSVKKLYDATGREFPREETLREFSALNQQFIKLHPDFIGIKFIFAVDRNQDVERIKGSIKEFIELQKSYPEFVVGFDLVGQEDTGKRLHTLLPVIRDLPSSTRLFLHGGETNWHGGSTDINLLDAIMLNAKRIGHAYALAKHPVLMNAVKTRQIAVELSPISNQVLHLVWDMRNHPGAQFLAVNVPVVICNDDPGFWNAKGLSYDFYYAIMSMAPNDAGLRILKALVWNSVRFSTLTKQENTRANKILEQSWKRFLDTVSGWKRTGDRLSFPRRENLQRHVRTHTGERTKSCSLCQLHRQPGVRFKERISRTHKVGE